MQELACLGDIEKLEWYKKVDCSEKKFKQHSRIEKKSVYHVSIDDEHVSCLPQLWNSEFNWLEIPEIGFC